MRVLVPLPIDLSVMANGRTLRVVYLLRELNHHCDLTCLVPGDHRLEAARQALPNLHVESAEIPTRAASGAWPADLLPLDWLSRKALGFVGFDPPLLRATVAGADSYDTVLAFDTISLAYLLAVEHRRRGRTPRLVADMIDDPWLSYLSMCTARKLSPEGIKQAIAVRRLRARLIARLDVCTAVAPRDAETLAEAAGLATAVVPNGVVLPDGSCLESRRENLVVFTGAMQFPPNASAACWMAKRVWPLVWSAMGGRQARRLNAPDPVRLAIVGASPPPQVRKLGEIPGVVVTGAVEDVGLWLKRARVAAAPMVSGSGIKNKVLEAAASGCPVVSTPLGVDGLPTGEVNGSLVASTRADFADRIVLLLQNPAMAHTIGLAGRAMVSSQYAWPRMARRMLRVLQGPTPAPGPDGPEEAPVPTPRADRNREALTHAAS